jgi:hypothetical protein
MQANGYSYKMLQDVTELNFENKKREKEGAIVNVAE